MGEEAGKRRHRFEVASHVPGRIRLRLDRIHRGPQAFQGIKSILESREGVRDVRMNPATGSVTVEYDPRRHGEEGVRRFLEDVDVLVGSIANLPSLAPGGEDRSPGSFLDAVDDVQRAVRDATGISFDLRKLLPLAFLGAGVWSIARKGLMIESIPGLVLLWLAFDTFVKLNPGERPVRPAPDTGELSV